MTVRNSLARAIVLLGIAMLFASYGCERRGWKQIPIKDVRRILPSYTLLMVSLDQHNIPDSQRRAAYESFLSEQGYTLSDWDSSMALYARNELTLLHDIYRTAADSLERSRTVLQTRFERVIARENYDTNRRLGILDSVNLLSIGSRWYKAGDPIHVNFDFSPSSAYDSTYQVELSTTLNSAELLDTLVYPFLELRLHFSDSTTLYSSTPLLHPGRHAVSLSIPSGKKAQKITGALSGRIPTRLWWGVQLDSLRLVRYPIQKVEEPLLDPTQSLLSSEENGLELEEELM